MNLLRFIARLFHRHEWLKLDFYDRRCIKCGLVVKTPRPKR